MPGYRARTVRVLSVAAGNVPPMTNEDDYINGWPPDSAPVRLAKALGREPSQRMSEEERKKFWAEQDRVNEELARRFGPPDAA